MKTVAWETAFQIALRTCSEEVRGSSDIQELCNKGQAFWISEDYYPKKFGTLLCMGRCKSWVSLKLFLWYISQLFGAHILCFHILSFHRVPDWHWRLQLLMTVTYLFTDMAGNSSIFQLKIRSIQWYMTLKMIGLNQYDFIFIFHNHIPLLLFVFKWLIWLTVYLHLFIFPSVEIVNVKVDSAVSFIMVCITCF